jgi:hypothetical protein
MHSSKVWTHARQQAIPIYMAYEKQHAAIDLLGKQVGDTGLHVQTTM